MTRAPLTVGFGVLLRRREQVSAMLPKPMRTPFDGVLDLALIALLADGLELTSVGFSDTD